MSLPKKGTRKIVVNKLNYIWKVTGNDGWIDLYITSSDVKNGQLLNVKFHYHFKPENTVSETNPQFKISPRIVKQVINHGLKNNWNPLEKKTMLELGHIEGEINLYPS